jgi:hypothetical protein
MPNTFLSKARNQAQSFTFRFYSDSEVHGLSLLSSMCRRPEQHSILPPLPLITPPILDGKGNLPIDPNTTATSRSTRGLSSLSLQLNATPGSIYLH